MNVKQTFALRIYWERELKNWNQSNVAHVLGLNATTTYSSWEQAHRMPSAEMLVKIADLYNVSVDYLLGRVDEKEFQLKKAP